MYVHMCVIECRAKQCSHLRGGATYSNHPAAAFHSSLALRSMQQTRLRIASVSDHVADQTTSRCDGTPLGNCGKLLALHTVLAVSPLHIGATESVSNYSGRRGPSRSPSDVTTATAAARAACTIRTSYP
jgi:hypothetical protein